MGSARRCRCAGPAPSIRVSIVPALRMTRCDDWNDYPGWRSARLSADGMFLGSAVRAYFANGGSRCYVSTVRRPDVTDADDLALAAQAMVGVQGPARPTPPASSGSCWSTRSASSMSWIFYASARQHQHGRRQCNSPPPAQDACFQPCSDYLPAPVIVEAAGPVAAGALLYPADLYDAVTLERIRFLGVQLQLAARCRSWNGGACHAAAGTPADAGRRCAYMPPKVLDAVSWRNIFDAQQKAGILGGADPDPGGLHRAVSPLAGDPGGRWRPDLPAAPRHHLPPASSRGGISHADRRSRPPTKP